MSGLQPVKRPARESLRSSPASWRLFVCTCRVDTAAPVSMAFVPSFWYRLPGPSASYHVLVDTCLPLGNGAAPVLDNTDVATLAIAQSMLYGLQGQ